MKVIVIGAGIAGLATAKNLADSGWQVEVLEKFRGPRASGYMVDFFGPGYDAAEKMGVLPELQARAYSVQEVAYVNRKGHTTGRLSYARFADAVDGRLMSIMRPDLEEALRESLPASVRLRYGVTFEQIENNDNGVCVHTSDGRRVDADLVIGADGIHSAVREAVFGPESRYIDYLGFHTAAFTFEDPVMKDRVSGRFALSDTKNRQIGLYGLRDSRVAAFLIHRNASPALPANRRESLRNEFSGVGWLAPRALDQAPADLYYDVVAQIHMEQWHSGRVVLVGDACQAVSLLAGQGASLAVAGARILSNHLAESASIAEGLAAYEEQWMPVAREKQEAGRRAARWFLPSSGPELLLRRLMLKLSGLPLINRFIGTSLAGKAVPVS
ncbi:FAD-dependent oxidoreductase [Arthrobacter sp. Soil782]|uniref:FAD-dependent oxidoreductase n=1 Tax=Arthrobacter sp. Soil782 TaxID=1736410 RepID=UPI0006F68344|nr:FAD-dependent oxidoreductase [Arthrobacter sp. Soil782]KRF08338.1 FAD-dependent oxidoreductase [Arthrobacter sp. Soil782]